LTNLTNCSLVHNLVPQISGKYTHIFYVFATRDSVGESVLFLGCPVVPFVHPLTTLSHEQLEQFW